LTEAEVEDKRITLSEAARKVSDGDGLFWGGFGYQRPPIAFSHELVRQKKRNLTVYTCGSEVDLEIMAGAGVANRYEIAFSAIEALGLSNNIRRRVSEGLLHVEDYTNLAMAMESPVQLMDCDVEEPNAHLFLHPRMVGTETVMAPVPKIDAEKCVKCGKCFTVCRFEAVEKR